MAGVCLLDRHRGRRVSRGDQTDLAQRLAAPWRPILRALALAVRRECPGDGFDLVMPIEDVRRQPQCVAASIEATTDRGEGWLQLIDVRRIERQTCRTAGSFGCRVTHRNVRNSLVQRMQQRPIVRSYRCNTDGACVGNGSGGDDVRRNARRAAPESQRVGRVAKVADIPFERVLRAKTSRRRPAVTFGQRASRTQRKPAPGPPPNHFTHDPTTASGCHSPRSIGITPMDCATSTMLNTACSLQSPTSSRTRLRMPLFEWTCVMTTASISAVRCCAQTAASSGGQRSSISTGSKPSGASALTAKPSEGNALACSKTLRAVLAGGSEPSILVSPAETFGCGQNSWLDAFSSRPNSRRKRSIAASQVGQASPPQRDQGARKSVSTARRLALGRQPME